MIRWLLSQFRKHHCHGPDDVRVNHPAEWQAYSEYVESGRDGR